MLNIQEKMKEVSQQKGVHKRGPNQQYDDNVPLVKDNAELIINTIINEVL